MLIIDHLLYVLIVNFGKCAQQVVARSGSKLAIKVKRKEQIRSYCD